MTPQKFAKKYIRTELGKYIPLVHDPRNPIGRVYTVKFLGNVVGADPFCYLNVDIETLKKATLRSLQDDQPVWMGCDVDKQMSNGLGIWDKQLYDYSGIYQTDFPLTKRERLLCRETQMSHAMLFTGVDVVKGKPRRWRVENSWGSEEGQKGFYTMNDSWFDEYMFEISVHKKYLTPKLRKKFDQKPMVLPPWDPMGSLA